ncbi:ParB/RepB/Spo0J family partition protein [Chryseobacterium indoltheticum]|nr:ParB/RepB/Spo0J family partition protein [Chryseobacterium indoltheticum]
MNDIIRWNPILDFNRIYNNLDLSKKQKELKYQEILDTPSTWIDNSYISISNSKTGLLRINTNDKNNPAFVFYKKITEVIKNSNHTYNILFDTATLHIPNLLNIGYGNNVVIGLHMEFGLLEFLIHSIFQDTQIHRKYLHISTFDDYIDVIDYSRYAFEWLVIDLQEDCFFNLLRFQQPFKTWHEAIHLQRLNCEKHNVPFHFKSWGKVENNPNPNDPTLNPVHRYYTKTGCMLDGKIYYYDPITKTTAPTLTLFDNEYYIMDEHCGLNTIWELKSYLPFMKPELFELLKEDIHLNGLNDPILYILTKDSTKVVIEGHTRLRACIELDIKDFPIKEVKEDFDSIEDIQLWMLKHQFQRRNMSSVERLELAYQSKEIIEKRAKLNLSKAGKGDSVTETFDTNLEIAQLAGVGKTTVVNYGNVMAKASPNLIEQMRKGKLSISGAYNKIKDKTPKSEKTNPEIVYLKSFDEGKVLMGKNCTSSNQLRHFSLNP